MFKSWDEYTELEQYQIDYSELHKDVYGVRARFHYDWSLEELKDAYDRLCKEAEEEFAREQEAQKQAAIEFENTLVGLIELGAEDRETALRWLLDSTIEYDMDRCYIDNDPSYVRFLFNLPGNYDWRNGTYYSEETV